MSRFRGCLCGNRVLSSASSVDHMNLPNIITLSRIPLMFLVVWLMYQGWPGAATLAFWLFIVAAVGDWLDGYIARKRKLVSTFGKFMDALTDKIFVIGIMIALRARENNRCGPSVNV